MSTHDERSTAAGMTRRKFIQGASGLASAAAITGVSGITATTSSGCSTTTESGSSSFVVRERAPGALPRRAFGKHGFTVPILGMGTAAAGKHAKRSEATKLFDEAIDLGVCYMDAAPNFAGYGEAQVALGDVLNARRDEVFLVTKCWEPKAADAETLLAKNLEELQTDRADLVYAHSVGDDKMELDLVTGKGGVLEYLQRAKEKGLTRFVGISGHSRPWRFVKILERFDIDVVMCAVNVADRHTYDFETQVFPLAAKKGCAVVAMKVLGGERSGSWRCMMPPKHHDMAFRYALSLPEVSTAVIGMKDRKELDEHLARARKFVPLSTREREALKGPGVDLAQAWGPHLGPVN